MQIFDSVLMFLILCCVSFLQLNTFNGVDLSCCDPAECFFDLTLCKYVSHSAG